MRVVLFASPACGPEAVAAALAQSLAVPHINFGDLMRSHLTRRTELGIRAIEIMKAGEPFPDEFASAVVRDHFHRAAPSAFLLRGHPHSAAQSIALDDLLQDLGTPLDSVLYLRLSEEETERQVLRQAARRVCANNSSHWFGPTVDRLVAEGVCNVCGGDLYQRKDDSESTVRGRFSGYEAMLQPITQHYTGRGILITADGSGTTREAVGRALTALRHQNR